MDFHVVGALRLGDGEELGDVLGASVAEPHGARVVGQVELDLELAPVPSGLGGVVVGVDPELATADASPLSPFIAAPQGCFLGCLSRFRLASCCCLISFCF